MGPRDPSLIDIVFGGRAGGSNEKEEIGQDSADSFPRGSDDFH